MKLWNQGGQRYYRKNNWYLKDMIKTLEKLGYKREDFLNKKYHKHFRVFYFYIKRCLR